MNALKPCPNHACGGEGHADWGDYIACNDCHVMGPDDDRDGAKWNAMLRPADIVAARVEGLREALAIIKESKREDGRNEAVADVDARIAELEAIAPSKAAAPTDAPVEERHRRAAWDNINPGLSMGSGMEHWAKHGPPLTAHPALYVTFESTAQALANAERDGRASRDAEVAELRAYRRALGRFIAWADAESERNQLLGLGIARSWNKARTYLAEELARKGTP